MLYDQLTIREHIQFISRAYQSEQGETRAQALLERLELADKTKKTARELSKGMSQKLSMVLALLADPDSILIDAYILHQGKIVREVRREDLGDQSLKEIFFACTQGEQG